ncbi:MAG: SH3 domain-containing protein [Roseburia sp.]|nr:SH3 domain-containing protein [Roseburia sp.]MCM1096504.1 SH3 domain-containing protein [Ruminococcus flavefaciens]
MKKKGTVKRGRGLLLAALTLVLTAALWLLPEGSGLVSHAESQGRVTATSANIRKEPSSTSEVIGSTEKDKIITITSQTTGSDGNTWYQTFVNSETLGYIRSDLVTIIDGTTPATTTTVPATTTTSPASTPVQPTVTETPADVSPVNPVSATVSGSTVRVRSNASTSSNIVEKVSNGLAVTVNGTATGADGKTWYQVSFTLNGAEKEGFIRSDYLKLSEELTPYVEPEEPEPTTSPEPETPPEPEITVVKDFDTSLEDGVWYLLDMQNNVKHNIKTTLEAVDNNAKAYQEAEKQVKSQKAIIIVLVLLLVAAVAAITLLFFKMKEMSDAAYFSEVEKETLRRRGTASSRGQNSSQKVMHTVGSGSQSGRPAGQRLSGNVQGSGQRTTGTKPSGASQGSQGQRAAGSVQGSQGQKPTGTRPAGASQGSAQSGQGARPAGTSQGSGQGQRAAGSAQGSQGQKPTGARPAGSAQSGQGQKNAGNRQGWQSKNFMAEDDDEFEFEFLNYDGDEEG